MLLPLLALVFQSSSGMAPTQNHHDSVPKWAKAPDQRVLRWYFPFKAWLFHVRGQVKLKCVLSKEAVLGQCVIIEETPPNFGFGSSAEKIAAAGNLFVFQPKIRDGVPVESEVIIPVNFDFPRGRRASDPSTQTTASGVQIFVISSTQALSLACLMLTMAHSSTAPGG